MPSTPQSFGGIGLVHGAKLSWAHSGTSIIATKINLGEPAVSSVIPALPFLSEALRQASQKQAGGSQRNAPFGSASEARHPFLFPGSCRRAQQTGTLIAAIISLKV